MSAAIALSEHLAPDSISSLERAAQNRYDDAERLLSEGRFLAALYFLGYSVEMCLVAAYYRSAGFHVNTAIDRDTRQRRMAQARQLGIMNSDPHPLVGWARFLEWHRSSNQGLTRPQRQIVKEAIGKAASVYKHWRPALRYKTAQVVPEQLDEVRKAASWFLTNRSKL